MRISFSILILFLFLLNTQHLFGQKRKIDSMENLLRQLTQKPQSFSVDTSKVNLLAEIGFQMSNYSPDSAKALNYLQQGLALAEKIKWGKGGAETYDIMGRVYARKTNYTRAI